MLGDDIKDRHTIALKLSYELGSIAVTVQFKADKNKAKKSAKKSKKTLPANTNRIVEPATLARFLNNIQTLYERICDALLLQTHVLELEKIDYPNGVYEFNGVRDAVDILQDLLVAAPDYILSIGMATGSTASNGSAGGANVQREQSSRQLEILTPVIRDLAKMLDKQSLSTKHDRRQYIVRCLASVLESDTQLSTILTVTD